MADTRKDSEILALWRSGEDGVAIAKALGTGSTNVYRALKRHGIRPSQEKRRPKVDWRRKHTLEQEKEIVRRYQAGEKLAGLAREFSCTPHTIRNVVTRNDVVVRPVGGQVRIWSPAERDEAIQKYVDGESKEDLARRFRTDTRQVNRLVNGATRGLKESLRYGSYLAVLLSPDDPMASMRNSAGYVMEHRLVIARHLGRPLTANETVHHINGDKLDNRLENLQLRQGRHGKGVAHRCRTCGSTDIETIEL